MESDSPYGSRRDQDSGNLNLTRYDGRRVPEVVPPPDNTLSSRRYSSTRLRSFRGEYLGI